MNPNPNKETPEQELEARVRIFLIKFQEHVEKDHPDPDMRECAWVDDGTQEITQLFATHYKAREAEQKPVGDAIEVKVAADVMRHVLNACKQSDRTIAKRILERESDVAEWRDVSNDEPVELQIWQLKILASLTGKYNWAVFLLKPENLPGSKDSKS